MKFLLRSSAVCCLLLASVASAAIVTADRIVAVVNRNAITQLDLNERIASIRRNLAAQGIQAPDAQALAAETLDRMITEQVLIQQAKLVGVRVDDNQLEQSLGRIAQQNRLSLPELRQAVEKDGQNWRQFSEDIRQEMTLTFLRQKEVDNRVVVTDSEIDDFLRLNADVPQMEYRIAQITAYLPENATPDQLNTKRQQMALARQALASGKDFSVVAATYSNSPDANNGGEIGWRPNGALAPEFVELLNQLKIGEVTDVVRSNAGLHMFKLLDKRTQSNKVVIRQTHAAHILAKPNELLSETDARVKLVQLRERLVHGENFAELARLFSDDGSASNGGDLGWLSPGDTVPEFEQAMDKLNPGELSQPIQTPFGFHLIKVTERRDQDMTTETQRAKARQDLRTRKSAERYDDWVRQLRDQASISIRLKDE